MTNDPDERSAELLAGALADDLSPAEQQELAGRLAEDAALREEFSAMSDLVTTMRSSVLGEWREEAPSAQLRRAVQQISDDGNAEPQIHAVDSLDTGRRVTERRATTRPRRSVWFAGAAACIAAGVALTLGAQYALDAPPQGPPGTFGVVESVNFRDTVTGVDIDGSLIAHTWGTETVLEIDGLAPGASFAVVLTAQDGRQFESGTFFGSEIPIDCRMNAAVMRQEVQMLEIRDADGQIVTAAELPAAIDPQE